MKRAAIYTRVSSEEQVDGYSLAAQEDATRQLCASRGWQVVRVYSDPGRSGRTTIRPGFQAMMADAEAGLIDLVAVHKLDRFSRSLLDTLKNLGELQDHNVSFISATEDFDFTSPYGKLMLMILGAFAQWYVENLAAEVRKGKYQRAKDGRPNGSLSFGYTTLPRLKAELEELGASFTAGKIEQDFYAERADLMEQTLEKYANVSPGMAFPHPINQDGAILAFNMYAPGETGRSDIALELNNRGYRTINGNLFSYSTVRTMLQSRFYLGEVSYVGKGISNQRGIDREWFPGEHEAIISQELFDRAQQAQIKRQNDNDSSTRPRKTYHAAAFSGLLVCEECGSRFRYSGPRDKNNHARYRDQARNKGIVCQRRPISIKEYLLEEQILSLLSELTIPDDWKETYEAMARQKSKAVTPPDEINAKIATLENQLKRLRRLFKMGDIDEEEYVAERDAIKQQIPELPSEEQPEEPPIEPTLELLYDFAEIWRLATSEERNKLLRLLVKKLIVNGERITTVQAKPVLYALVRYDIISHDDETNDVTSDQNRAISGVDPHPLPSGQTSHLSQCDLALH